ncbi:UNVERIFIED_ORG: hypothetical protein B2H93_16680 [Clostridium botulinum]
MNIKRYKRNISIFDIKVRINGGVDMATISLEREIKLTPRAIDNLVKIVNKPSKFNEQQYSNNVTHEIEEGKKLLAKLFSR